MRANHRFLKVTAVVATVQATTVLLATRAFAAPTPTPTASNDPCDLIRGPAKDYCERGNGAKGTGGTGGGLDPTSTLDPLSSSPRAAPRPPPGPSTSSARP